MLINYREGEKDLITVFVSLFSLRMLLGPPPPLSPSGWVPSRAPHTMAGGPGISPSPLTSLDSSRPSRASTGPSPAARRWGMGPWGQGREMGPSVWGAQLHLDRVVLGESYFLMEAAECR